MTTFLERLSLFATLALTGGFLGQAAYSQGTSTVPAFTGAGILDQGPGGDPIAEATEIRREFESGDKIDSVFSERVEPLHKAWDVFAKRLRQNGLEIAFQYTAMVQNSSDLLPGIEDALPGAANTLSGGDADLSLKWHAYRPGEPDAGYFRLSAEHRHRYDALPAVAMGPQLGSLWLTMKGWNEYSSVALTEAYWHQGTLESPFEFRIGRIKNTTIWNGGKYVGGNTGIIGAQFTGTPAFSMPGSGWSATAVYHPVGGNAHVVAGVFQANGDNEAVQPLRGDELTYAVQVGFKPELRGGQGRYHIFAWHIDETDTSSEANGFAVNAEQEFGNWTPFLRYSFGDQDRSDPKSHEIRQSANIGIGYDGVFGRSRDWAAIVASWAEPTDEGLRDQYGLEADYHFRLTPHMFLTPHVQLLHDPSRNPDKRNALVVGLRTRIEF